ncbi:AAA family ATPase [Photobacterium leiognathi]|uniref:AAA family ATPase n=1 Tax=Photobacterium leiognathi TaxID=553611 RepID=UPI0015E7DD91|nr:AAA family ATPase [Photobacterium leiognathi]
MKLIYLYVKDFKVLKDCEIKLSSQYTFEKKRSTLKISKSKIEDGFYADNLDIVSLFGRNGTGKSTAIELITLVLSNNIPELCEIIAIYEENGIIYSYLNMDNDIKVFFDREICISIYKEDLDFEKHNIVFFSHHVEPLTKKIKFKNTKLFKYKDCSNQAYLSQLNSKNFTNKEIRNCFDLLSIFDMCDVRINKVPMFGASYPIQEVIKYLSKINNNLFKYITVISENERYEIKELIHKVVLKYNVNGFSNIEFYERELSAIEFKNIFDKSLLTNISKDLISKSGNYIDLILSLDIFNSIIADELDCLDDDSFDNNYYLLVKFYIETLLSNKGIVSQHEFLYQMHVDRVLKNNHINDYKDDSINAYELYHLSNFIESTFMYNDEGRFEIPNYESFEFVKEIFDKNSDLFSNFELKWNGISSGQYSLLIMFSRIFKELRKGDDLLIFIDEGEINLHPEWQRTYIKELVGFFSKLKLENQKIQLVITSHSPFVLCDLPKESVNIFNENKQDNFFGSNIYDIYSKGFLLERTVGQFSYEKISLAIDKIKVNKEDYWANEIIDMIGDRLIKEMIKDIK